MFNINRFLEKDSVFFQCLKTPLFCLLVFFTAVPGNLYSLDLRPAETNAADLRHPDIENIFNTKLRWINEAQKSIDIEMWNFWRSDRGEMRDLHNALEEASERGVQIRIAVGVNHGHEDHVSNDYFKGENIRVKHVDPAAHSKYMVVDDKRVTVGAANWSWTAMHQNYEFNLNSEDPRLAGAFTYLFESLWGSSGGDITGRGGYFETDTVKPLARGRYVPSEFKRIADKQMKLIDSAEDEIIISLYHHKPVFEDLYKNIHLRLIAASERGVRITFLIDKDAYEGEDKRRIDELASLENTYIKIIDLAPAPPLEGSGSSHSKIFLTDSVHGVISSMNWDRFTFDDSGRDAGIYFKRSDLYEIIKESVLYSFYSPYSTWAEGQYPIEEKEVFPPAVTAPMISGVTPSSAIISGGLIDDGDAEYPGVYFIWQRLSSGGNFWHTSSAERINSPSEVSYIVEELDPDTEYVAAMQAINEAGRVRSRLIQFRTFPD